MKRITLVEFKEFGLSKFFGDEWSVWRGPSDKDGLLGEEEIYSEQLKRIGFSDLAFRYCLKESECFIPIGESIKRLNETPDFIGFGPELYLVLWENYRGNYYDKKNSILERIYQEFGIRRIYFPRVIFRSRNGYRNIILLRRDDNAEKWIWDCSWLGDQSDRNSYFVGYDPTKLKKRIRKK